MKTSQNIHQSRIARYFLILGRACNMHCIYCIQGQDKLDIDSDLPDPKEIVKYFPETGKYDLVLYGGEPTLYWNFVEKFAYYMGERNPDANLRMTTNGKLLTKERAKVLNDLNVHVSMSHDGYKFEITRRDKDPLIVNPEPFLTLNRRSILSVYSNLNSDFYNVWDYFEQFKIRHGLDKKESIAIRHLKDSHGSIPDDLFIYNNPEWEKMLDKVMANLYHDLITNNTDSYEYKNYEIILKSIINRAKYSAVNDDIGPWCGTDSSIVQIDVYGNMYQCLNSYDSFGNANDMPLSAGPKSDYRYDPICKKCDIYFYCGGGCIVTKQDKRKYLCYAVYQETSRLIETIMKVGMM